MWSRILERLGESLEGVDGELILVSNEIGLGLVPDTELGREFRDLHGRMNQRVAVGLRSGVVYGCGVAGCCEGVILKWDGHGEVLVGSAAPCRPGHPHPSPLPSRERGAALPHRPSGFRLSPE